LTFSQSHDCIEDHHKAQKRLSGKKYSSGKGGAFRAQDRNEAIQKQSDVPYYHSGTITVIPGVYIRVFRDQGVDTWKALGMSVLGKCCAVLGPVLPSSLCSWCITSLPGRPSCIKYFTASSSLEWLPLSASAQESKAIIQYIT
jgi:hypothetical protein